MDNLIKSHIDDILSSREYMKTDDAGILARIAEYLKNAVEGIRSWFEGLQVFDGTANPFDGQLPASGFAGFKVIGVIVIAALVMAVVLVLHRNIRPAKRMKEKDDSQIFIVFRNSDTAEKKALEFFYKGQYTQGLRFLYLSLLLKLDELNVIKIDRSKTNNQYLREAYNNQFASYEKLREFTRVFNDCWYGGKNVSKECFEHWYSQYSLLVKGGVQ